MSDEFVSRNWRLARAGSIIFLAPPYVFAGVKPVLLSKFCFGCRQVVDLPGCCTDGMMSRCASAWHIGIAKTAAGVSARILLTTRRSGDLFRRIGASRGACSRPATCPMDVRGYAMRSLRRGLSCIRQAMPGTVRCSAIALPVATMNRLQGIVWSGLPGQSVRVCVTPCPRRHPN